MSQRNQVSLSSRQLWISLALIATVGPGWAMDLKQAKITQVVNDVKMDFNTGVAPKAVKMNDIFSIDNTLYTGPASRAELTAADDTVTRVGANTVFSFEADQRTMRLKQGSMLFHSPHGKGGGTIHTTSATASVLGTTLIVCATPNGGFKILDLEGSVKITLPNGQTQILKPSQMTFVLPANPVKSDTAANPNKPDTSAKPEAVQKLAPVVTFKLDELINNSQLIKGFSTPVSSLPLIQNQISTQNKEISTGKLTVTPLYAGNEATQDTLKVYTVDNSTTVAAQPSAQDLAKGETVSLGTASTLLPSSHLFITESFSIPGNSFFANQTFYGFLASSITIDGPTASSVSPLITSHTHSPRASANPPAIIIDLSPYSLLLSEFDMVAVGNFSINHNVTFQESALDLPSLDLALLAGGQLTIAPGVAVTLLENNCLIASPLGLTLDNNALTAYGTLHLNFGQSITAANSTFESQNGDVAVNSAQAITLSGGDLLALNGEAYLHSSASISVTAQKTFQVGKLTLNSGDGILLDSAGGATQIGVNGATAANLTAPNRIEVNNIDFGNFAAVNLAAKTINLTGVNFSSLSPVTLSSLYGSLAPNPNTFAASQYGYVNFIAHVTCDGNPAQNYVNNGRNITITPLIH